MKHFLIDLLLKLLGFNHRNFKVDYLFGATDLDQESRKKRWEHALKRLWQDKDLLDYLYYQSEADKENAFRGKVSKDLVKGARLRTLFIVYQAKRAYLNKLKAKKETAEEQSFSDEELKKVDETYKKLVDVN